MEEDLFVKEDIRMEDKLVWKTIWVGRQTGMEDKLGWKMTLGKLEFDVGVSQHEESI